VGFFPFHPILSFHLLPLMGIDQPIEEPFFLWASFPCQGTWSQSASMKRKGIFFFSLLALEEKFLFFFLPQGMEESFHHLLAYLQFFVLGKDFPSALPVRALCGSLKEKDFQKGIEAFSFLWVRCSGHGGGGMFWFLSSWSKFFGR